MMPTRARSTGTPSSRDRSRGPLEVALLFPPIGISENVDSADSGSAGGNGNVRWDATVEREVGWGPDALEFRVKLASVLARKLR
jgi:hypothetical protein